MINCLLSNSLYIIYDTYKAFFMNQHSLCWFIKSVNLSKPNVSYSRLTVKSTQTVVTFILACLRKIKKADGVDRRLKVSETPDKRCVMKLDSMDGLPQDKHVKAVKSVLYKLQKDGVVVKSKDSNGQIVWQWAN